MKLLVIADIDDFRWKHGAGEADVLLSCGDVCDEVIAEAAKSFGCRHIFAVKGNHDSGAPFPDPINDLHLQAQVHGDWTFGGLNGSWKYKPRGNFLYEQWQVEDFLSQFPAVDIFCSHNSPRGIHDREDDVHYGFDALVSYISKTKPKYLIHGHQHVDQATLVDETQVIGVFGHRLIEIEEI